MPRRKKNNPHPGPMRNRNTSHTSRSSSSMKSRTNRFQKHTSAALHKGSAAAKQTAWGIAGVTFEALRNSRIVLVAFTVVVLILFGMLFDGIANFNKAYAGVSVGGIDVGGLNAEEIRSAVETEFTTRLKSAGVTIYANEDAMQRKVEVIETEPEDFFYSEESEEVQKQAWATNAESLQAYVDYETLSQRALDVGRANIFDRLKLFISHEDVSIPVNYNDAIIENLANEIDQAIGNPIENYGIEIVYGVASVTQGHDGEVIDRNEFKDELTQQFLSPETEQRCFVAHTRPTSVRVNQKTAEAAAQTVNSAISQGIRFIGNDSEWFAEPYMLGEWIQTVTNENTDGTWSLSPSFSLQKARSDVLKNIPPRFTNGEGHVTFSQTSKGITVAASSSGSFPAVGDAIEKLNLALFTKTGSTASNITIQKDGPVLVELESSEIPASMTLNEALSCGIVSSISEFSTSYTPGASERNANIHLAADLISNSIVKANGGIWSFNETAGECNEEKGFQRAKVITGNELTDDIGGGICQVATTVFNAVYEAGYPIQERHNHSVYIASYPQGRDAAISWPEPDLKWKNNSPSDILLVMTYTDSSVTATLYGEDMGYDIESEEGEWVDGPAFTTVYETDESLLPGVEYVKSYGTNGHTISVSRTVRDADGVIILSDTFPSVYKAEPTVIVRGSSEGFEQNQELQNQGIQDQTYQESGL